MLQSKLTHLFFVKFVIYTRGHVLVKFGILFLNDDSANWLDFFGLYYKS